MMTPKQYMSRAVYLDREIAALLHARAEARAAAQSTTRPMDGPGVHASADPHHRFDRLVELEEQIDDRVDRLCAVKSEILAAIAQVEDGRYRVLLTERYVNLRTWEEIAVLMHYDYRHVCRLHGQALQAVRMS